MKSSNHCFKKIDPQILDHPGDDVVELDHSGVSYIRPIILS